LQTARSFWTQRISRHVPAPPVTKADSGLLGLDGKRHCERSERSRRSGNRLGCALFKLGQNWVDCSCRRRRLSGRRTLRGKSCSEQMGKARRSMARRMPQRRAVTPTSYPTMAILDLASHDPTGLFRPLSRPAQLWRRRKAISPWRTIRVCYIIVKNGEARGIQSDAPGQKKHAVRCYIALMAVATFLPFFTS
jgi:hypothetical protein